MTALGRLSAERVDCTLNGKCNRSPMEAKLQEATKLVASNCLPDVIVGVEKLKLLYSVHRRPELLSLLLDCFFQKNSTVKRNVVAALGAFRSLSTRVILRYKSDMFKILYSNDEDALDALSRLICIFSSDLSEDDELFFELFRKAKYRCLMLLARFSYKHRKFVALHCMDVLRKNTRIFYLATKCNVEHARDFVSHCRATKNYKYLLKIVAHYPFIPRLYGVSMTQFTKKRCGRGFLSSREAKHLYRCFGFFEPEFCKKQMSIINEKDCLSYWSMWLLLQEHLRRRQVEKAAAILGVLGSLEGLHLKFRYVFQFYHERMMELCGGTVAARSVSLRLCLEMYGLQNSYVYKVLKRHYKKAEETP